VRQPIVAIASLAYCTQCGVKLLPEVCGG